jgi:peroxiredoxin
MRLIAAALLALALTLQGAAPVPRPVGDFVKVMDAHGQPISPASFKGKVVVVQFLYTWCPHCQDTARGLSKLQGEFGPQGLQVIGVAMNDEVNTKDDAANRKELRKFRSHSTFPIGIANKQAALKYLGITEERFGVPQVILIDRNGVIQGQTEPLPTGAWLNEKNLRDRIVKVLEH